MSAGQPEGVGSAFVRVGADNGRGGGEVFGAKERQIRQLKAQLDERKWLCANLLARVRQLEQELERPKRNESRLRVERLADSRRRLVVPRSG